MGPAGPAKVCAMVRGAASGVPVPRKCAPCGEALRRACRARESVRNAARRCARTHGSARRRARCTTSMQCSRLIPSASKACPA